jgi:pentose-5-phosphate-3-epimerase
VGLILSLLYLSCFFIIILSVYTGFGGQDFNDILFERISEIKKIIKENYYFKNN